MMQEGIVAGTVLAILVPIVIALSCFIAHLHVKSKEEDDSYGFEYSQPPPDARRNPQTYMEEGTRNGHSNDSSIKKKSISSSNNSSSYPHMTVATAPSNVSGVREDIEMQHYRESGSDGEEDGDSGGDDSSSFDGEYNTQEPVNDDSVTFQNVFWELPKPDQSQSKEAAV